MKAIKYLIAGALFAAVSTTAFAQEVSRDAQLEAIRNEIKANPNDPNAAKDLVKAYTKEYKKDADALVLLGNVYFGAKQYTKALEYADMALARNKNCGNAFILKGDVAAVSQDDGGEAAGWYQQAMTIDPKNPEGYMRYANVYRKRSPEESERALNELRKNIPDFPVEAEAAHTFYGTGNYEKAFEHFAKADKSKINEDQLAEYALTAMYIDKKDEALELAKYGITKFPENVSFIRLALINAIGTDKHADAVAYAEDLIKREGDKNAGDITYYGQALAGVKKYDEAIAQYQKALQLDDKNLKPLEYISEAYFGKGETDKALQYANEYLEKDDNARISDYDKLANIYMSLVKDSVDRQANFNKAMAVYDKVVTKFPQRATWAHSQKATAAFIAEMEDEYPQLYKVVIDELENKSDRTAAETQYLASAYRSMGYHFWASKNDLNAALPYFEKLVKFSPDNSLATKFFEAKKAYDEEMQNAANAEE